MNERILVVDDDQEIVRLLRSYLEQAGYQVVASYSGERAMHIIRREHPDLVLLDLMLPDKDGWEITRQMRSDEHLAGIPIVMLTARVTDEDKILGLELGADDYITKPYNPREVLARVRARLRAGQEMQQAGNQKLLRFGGVEMDLGRHRVRIDDREINLTVSEFEILRVLMEQAGYVLTRGELIRRALGADYLGMERSLDSHIRNLRRKLESTPGGSFQITTVYGVGYRLEEV